MKWCINKLYKIQGFQYTSKRIQSLVGGLTIFFFLCYSCDGSFGGVAQLARAFVWHSKGRRFNSDHLQNGNDFFLETLCRLEHGEDVCLHVLVKKSGSVPGALGAKMLSGAGGHICGTIGGGVFEHSACEETKLLLAQKNAPSAQSKLLYYNLGNTDDSAGMPAACGGEFWVLVLPLFAASSETREKIGSINAAVGGTQNPAPLRIEITADKNNGSFNFSVTNALAAAGAQKRIFHTETAASFFYSELLSAAHQVFIIGSGHIASELAAILARSDFRVTVFDDRDECFANPLFSAVHSRVKDSFDNVGNALDCRAGDFIVILTRGYKLDTAALRWAVGTEARYIGLIGSRKKIAYVKETLRNEGIAAEKLEAARIAAPVGLDIGGETPYEIAVAIAAEMLRELKSENPVRLTRR